MIEAYEYPDGRAILVFHGLDADLENLRREREEIDRKYHADVRRIEKRVSAIYKQKFELKERPAQVIHRWNVDPEAWKEMEGVIPPIADMTPPSQEEVLADLMAKMAIHQ